MGHTKDQRLAYLKEQRRVFKLYREGLLVEKDREVESVELTDDTIPVMVLIVMCAAEYFRKVLRLSLAESLIFIYAYAKGREIIESEAVKITAAFNAGKKIKKYSALMVLSSRGLVKKNSEYMRISREQGGGYSGAEGAKWEITMEGRRFMDAYCKTIMKLRKEAFVTNFVKFFSSTENIMNYVDLEI